MSADDEGGSGGTASTTSPRLALIALINLLKSEAMYLYFPLVCVLHSSLSVFLSSSSSSSLSLSEETQ